MVSNHAPKPAEREVYSATALNTIPPYDGFDASGRRRPDGRRRAKARPAAGFIINGTAAVDRLFTSQLPGYNRPEYERLDMSGWDPDTVKQITKGFAKAGWVEPAIPIQVLRAPGRMQPVVTITTIKRKGKPDKVKVTWRVGIDPVDTGISYAPERLPGVKSTLTISKRAIELYRALRAKEKDRQNRLLIPSSECRGPALHVAKDTVRWTGRRTSSLAARVNALTAEVVRAGLPTWKIRAIHFRSSGKLEARRKARAARKAQSKGAKHE